jgi:hypothetical protein
LRFFRAGATLSIIALLICATQASAAPTGGTVAGSAGAASKWRSAHRLPVVPFPAAPITASSPSLTYHGPVYEKTSTGQVIAYVPPVSPGQANQTTGGSPVGVISEIKPQLLVPGSIARVVGGLAAAPMSAPAAVQQLIWSANQIIGLPYIYGGGHASFLAHGYDCSGTVSFALHGAKLLSTPADSSEFMSWGSHGIGRWVTIFSNPQHAYMDVAGLRLDTSAADDPSNQQGPRWRPLRTGNGGYRLRHPLGL